MKVAIPHDWSGWPDAERHPAYQENLVPLHMSYDGSVGYIKIHKCASNTHALWLIRERGWGRGWRPGTRMHRLDRGFHKSPSPSSILVLVRDPIERYVSAVGTMGGFQYHEDTIEQVNRYHAEHDDLFTKNMNQHFWPCSWFTWEWEHFADRMEYRDISEGWDWFAAHRVEDVPERHTNRCESKSQIRDAILTPEVEARIRKFYQHDYATMEAHNVPFA